MTRHKWKLVLVLSEIVLILTWVTWVTWVMWNLTSFRLETVLVSVQNRCTVCAERTIGSEIILEAPDCTTR